MMAYEKSKRVRDNFGEFIYQFQPKTKTLIRKLEMILIKLYRQNVSFLFHQTCLNERPLSNYAHTHTRARVHTHTHTHTYIYIYIYIYINIIKKKQQTGHIRIINLFPSCYAFNRTSSDLMDRINPDLFYP